MKTIATYLLLAAALLSFSGCTSFEFRAVRGEGVTINIQRNRPCEIPLEPFYAPKQTRSVRITNPVSNPPVIGWFGDNNEPFDSLIFNPKQSKVFRVAADEFPITFNVQLSRRGHLKNYSQKLFPNSFGDDGFISLTLPEFNKK